MMFGLRHLKLRNALPDVTHSIDLRDGFEVTLRRWSKGHSSAVTKARRSGVIIRAAERAAEWQEYFDVYQDLIRRWGNATSSQYEWQLFTELIKLNPSYVTLWTAIHDGRIVAGALCFYSSRHAIYWHGAALESAFALRPVNLLLFEAIRDASSRSCEWFDFNPSGGHAGVANFKKSFGAVTMSAPVISRSSLSRKILEKLQATTAGCRG